MEPSNISTRCEQFDSVFLTQNQIKLAINELRVIPFFHPLFCACSGQLQGVEVLARISDPVYGILNPDSFLTSIEEVGTILPFTLALMNRVIPVIDYLSSSLFNLADSFIITLNVPPTIFSYPELLMACHDFIGSTPDHIKLALEMTERQKLSLGDIEFRHIIELKTAGVQLWLDDFGTGYSGFLSLKTGVFDGLKIPREFVSLESPVSTILRQSITGIGKNLSMTVIAEGIENLKQAEICSAEGIDYLQGYHFCRPLSTSEFLIYVKQNHFPS